MRLVHGEADGLPGLVVDRYGDLLSAQFLSAGVERWKATIADALLDARPAQRACTSAATPRRASARGWRRARGWLRAGDAATGATEVEIREHDWRFALDVASGHKTGFYLDQRDNRKLFAERGAPLRLSSACSTATATPAASASPRSPAARRT